MISLKGVSRSFGAKQVLRRIDLDLEPGCAYAVVAPNGSGKSTLLGLIAGIVSPTDGEVAFSPPDARRDVSLLLPGERNLYMKNTVGENLRLFAAMEAIPPAVLERRIRELPRDFRVVRDEWKTPVERLSYGQKRMVALASTVVTGKHCLLLDEPTEGLDPARVDGLADVVRHLSEDEGRTVVVASHDVRFLSRAVRRFVFLERGVCQLVDVPLDEVTLRRRYVERYGEE